MLCDILEGSREVQEGGDVCVHIADALNQLSQLLVQQKLTQQAIILQFKKTCQSEYDSVNWLRVNLGQQYIQISKNHMLSMCLKKLRNPLKKEWLKTNMMEFRQQCRATADSRVNTQLFDQRAGSFL